MFVALMFVVIPACTTDPNTQKPGCKTSNGSSAQAGTVSSALTLGPDVHNVTVSALDLDANREVTNTATYPVLVRGFALDLPFGRYDIELTDDANKLVARYPNVEVDGDIVLGAPLVPSRP
jgi:hypothetical protein